MEALSALVTKTLAGFDGAPAFFLLTVASSLERIVVSTIAKSVQVRVTVATTEVETALRIGLLRGRIVLKRLVASR
jgi:hypothetical protein